MKKKMLSFLCLSLILSMTACGAKEDLPNSLAETYTEESVESQVFVPSPTVVTMLSIADLDTYGIGYWKVDKEGIFSEATTSRVSVDEGHIKKTVISGEFTVTVRDVIPDYMYDASTPQVAIVTEFQSYPFTVYVGEEIGSQLQKDTVYVFSVMPFEVEYSVNEVDKMDLSALAWKGMRITGVRLAEEKELGLESLRLTYTKKDI